MVKRIIWSQNALADRISILDYWYKRIGNKHYSHKLDVEIKETISHLKKFPYIGRQMEDRPSSPLIMERGWHGLGGLGWILHEQFLWPVEGVVGSNAKRQMSNAKCQKSDVRNVKPETFIGVLFPAEWNRIVGGHNKIRGTLLTILSGKQW